MSSYAPSLALKFSVEDVIAARRELAKRNLPDFACMLDIPTVPLTDEEDADQFSVMRLGTLAKHHFLLLRDLQGIESGEIDNLMVLMPPGSAKSTYVDVVFIPWFMSRRSRRHVLLASYASDIAKKQGRRARQLIKSESFYNLTGLTLSHDQTAADQWTLSNGSEYMAGGLLSGLTGNRCALGVLDDPLRGRQAAESEQIRQTAWDAYLDDFCSRLIPGAPQVMIMTRWHEDDIAGRILPEGWDGESGVFLGRDGRKWKVLCLPAIADRSDDPLGREIGETLWPEWFSLEHWAPFKLNQRTWSSLYQQKPSPADGTFFQREWFEFYDPKKLPACHKYMSGDFAVTDGDGDYTEIATHGYTGDILYLACDAWYGQKTADAWIETALDQVHRHKPFCFFGESGPIRRAVEPFLVRRMSERLDFVRLEWLPRSADKPTMARSLQAMAAQRKVKLPDTEYGHRLLSQMLGFPGGKYDDAVDMAVMMAMAIDQAHPALIKEKPKPKVVDRWDRVFSQKGDAETWRTV